MPAHPTLMEFECNHQDCQKAYRRAYDLDRHMRTHGKYEDREYGCPYDGCTFRSNQVCGLTCHINSRHIRVRLPCDVTGCSRTFSDPSSRTKHKKRFHSAEAVNGRKTRTGPGPDRKAPYTVPVHAMVARHIKEHSRDDAKNILDQFATFSVRSANTKASTPSPDEPSSSNLHLNETSPSASYGGSSIPSSSTHRPTYPMQSTSRELRGVYHLATDVPNDRWSIDNNNQSIHQAYNANPEAAPTAWGYYPDAPVPSSSRLYQEPATYHPPEPSYQGPPQGDTNHSQTGRDQSCRCWDCVVVGPQTLAPLRGRYQEGMQMMQAQSQSAAPFPFTYSETGHVPPSDNLPPNSFNEFPSSVYTRPYPRMFR